MRTSLAVAALLVALVIPAAADRTAEDLAVVKKAVAGSAEASSTAKAPEGPGGPQWLHVRIVEKGAKKAKISVNLSLALVRSLGADWPLHLGCGPAGGRGRAHADGPTLGEILRALDSGESLVEVDGDDATIRVWVE